jgi:hypothetical protein
LFALVQYQALGCLQLCCLGLDFVAATILKVTHGRLGRDAAKISKRPNSILSSNVSYCFCSLRSSGHHYQSFAFVARVGGDQSQIDIDVVATCECNWQLQLKPDDLVPLGTITPPEDKRFRSSSICLEIRNERSLLGRISFFSFVFTKFILP